MSDSVSSPVPEDVSAPVSYPPIAKTYHPHAYAIAFLWDFIAMSMCFRRKIPTIPEFIELMGEDEQEFGHEYASADGSPHNYPEYVFYTTLGLGLEVKAMAERISSDAPVFPGFVHCLFMGKTSSPFRHEELEDYLYLFWMDDSLDNVIELSKLATSISVEDALSASTSASAIMNDVESIMNENIIPVADEVHASAIGRARPYIEELLKIPNYMNFMLSFSHVHDGKRLNEYV